MEGLLEIAVPAWIEKLKFRSFNDFENRRDSILESVCYKGDLLLYGSPRKGETTKLFNDLAEGLAWLALIAKGGVHFGDQHWDAEFLTDDQKVSALREEAEQQNALQSEAVPSVRGRASQKASRKTKRSSRKNGS